MNFQYHYNRIESAKQKRTVLTVRFRRKKVNVGKVVCNVPTETKNHKIRPYCVVAGKASVITWRDGTAFIQ